MSGKALAAGLLEITGGQRVAAQVTQLSTGMAKSRSMPEMPLENSATLKQVHSPDEVVR